MQINKRGAWRFVFDDTSPQIGDMDALAIKREAVERQLIERAKNAFQELAGSNLENASFAELLKVAEETKKQTLLLIVFQINSVTYVVCGDVLPPGSKFPTSLLSKGMSE